MDVLPHKQMCFGSWQFLPENNFKGFHGTYKLTEGQSYRYSLYFRYDNPHQTHWEVGTPFYTDSRGKHYAADSGYFFAELRLRWRWMICVLKLSSTAMPVIVRSTKERTEQHLHTHFDLNGI